MRVSEIVIFIAFFCALPCPDYPSYSLSKYLSFYLSSISLLSISLSLIISLSVSLIISLSLFLIISLSFFLIVSLLFQCDRSAADRPCGGGVRGVSERARGESDGREEREERRGRDRRRREKEKGKTRRCAALSSENPQESARGNLADFHRMSQPVHLLQGEQEDETEDKRGGE